jgi:hypothetical protein
VDGKPNHVGNAINVGVSLSGYVYEHTLGIILFGPVG